MIVSESKFCRRNRKERKKHGNFVVNTKAHRAETASIQSSWHRASFLVSHLGKVPVKRIAITTEWAGVVLSADCCTKWMQINVLPHVWLNLPQSQWRRILAVLTIRHLHSLLCIAMKFSSLPLAPRRVIRVGLTFPSNTYFPNHRHASKSWSDEWWPKVSTVQLQICRKFRRKQVKDEPKIQQNRNNTPKYCHYRAIDFHYCSTFLRDPHCWRRAFAWSAVQYFF